MQAVIYARISIDKSGEQAGVDRQIKECRALATKLRLGISHVYTDNDLSATSGKVRPEFEAMLAAKPKAIVSWHQDRLLRLTKDLERVIELDIPVYTVTAGTMDLATPAGRAVARTVAAWSQYEGEQKALRQKAKNQQNVERGYPVPGKRRYGFEPGNIVERVEEGDILRSVFLKVDAGTPLRQVMRDTGWDGNVLRRRLLNPTYAGWVVRDGQRYEAAPSVARILDRDLFERVERLVSDPKRRTSPGGTVSHLLSGIAKCGVEGCGSRLVFTANGYRCAAQSNHVFIKPTQFERHVTRELFNVLERRVRSDVGSVGLAEARQELEGLQAERERLTGLLVVGGIDDAPVKAALKALVPKVTAATQTLAEAEAASVEARLFADVRRTVTDWQAVGTIWDEVNMEVLGVDDKDESRRLVGLYDRWGSLSLDEKRTLLRGTLAITVNKGSGLGRVLVTPIETP